MDRFLAFILANRLFSGILASVLLHATIYGTIMGVIAWGEVHAEYRTDIDLKATPLLTLGTKPVLPPPETWILAKKSKAPPPPVQPTPTPDVAATVASRQPSWVGGLISEDDYPMEMRRQKKEGKVIVELLINIEGKVDGVTILQGADPAFNEVVLQRLKEARFQPALDQTGQPMNCRVRLPISFKLN